MILNLINKRMFRMKLHYVLYMGGTASIVGFMPTIAKQLGYSPATVGFIQMYLSILAFLLKPVAGVVVDKFPVKRILFLTSILSCGLASFAFNFVQKLPAENAVRLSCDATTGAINVCSYDDDDDDHDHDDDHGGSLQLSRCDDDLSALLRNVTEPVECQLFCQQNESLWDKTCKSWNAIDYCTNSNNTFKNIKLDYLNTTLFTNITDQTEIKYAFQVKSVQINGQNVLQPVCRKLVTTRCEVDCSNNVVVELTTVSKVEKRSVFDSYQFWEFIVIISIFFIGTSVTMSLHDMICFDLLGDKPGDFGKQRCWGSVSWGLFSIFGGSLIDYFSDAKLYKNYTPIYYSCLITILCDFAVSYKIKVTETVGSKHTFTDVLQLLTKSNVIIYFIWTVVMGVCTSMIWNYLFWYMEDITIEYQSDMQPWIKILQGLVNGIQCIGGELPLYFYSGWIIKRIGHENCMSLGLFAFSARFYLYSVITNPVWILPVEFVNGITFGLFHAVLMSYARIIAPKNAVTTLVGISGSLFEGVGLSLGGFLGGLFYERYGGAQTFRLFSYGSLSMCIIHVTFTKLVKFNVLRGRPSVVEVT